MKKILNNIYSVILIVLIFLSFYQTGRLWFGTLSDYNPFSRNANAYLNNKVIPDGSYSKYLMTQPQEMIVYLSSEDPSFAIIENSGKDYKALYTQSLQILNAFTNAQQQKVQQQTIKLDYDVLWEGVQGSLIFDYDYVINNAIFTKEVMENNAIDIDAIGGVDLIGIELAKSPNRDLNVYLANTLNSKMIQLTMTIDDEQFNELYMIDNKSIFDDYFDQKVNIEFAYLSTEKANKKQFDGYNLYLRVPALTSFLMKNSDFIDIQKPYITSNKVDAEKFNDYAESYFDNPEIAQNTHGKEEEYYLYWDSNITVKYKNSGLLEYNRIFDSASKVEDMTQAYYIAMDFMHNYCKWAEFSLADYEIMESGIITFYFDYSVNNNPLIIKHLDTIGLTYPAQVSVRGNQIDSAQMYLIESQLTGINKEIKDFYTNVLDRTKIKNQIKNIFMAYVTEVGEVDTELKWIIELADTGEKIEEVVKLGE